MSDARDVAVIGAGLAGVSAALFAAAHGLRVVQVGNAGALLFSSGLLDLLAGAVVVAHPGGLGAVVEDAGDGAELADLQLPALQGVGDGGDHR